MGNLRKLRSYDLFKSMINELAVCMDDFLYVYDIKQDKYCISAVAAERFKLPDTEFTDVIVNHKQFVYAEDYPMLKADLTAMVAGEKDFHNLHYRWLGKDDEVIWINCRGTVIKDENGEPFLMCGCINEIGGKQKADNLSGLLGETALHQIINDKQECGMHGFMLRLGLDEFKKINERKGVDFGDELLKQTAVAISSVLNKDQMVFRIVSDQFVVMDMTGGTREDAIDLYRRITRAIVLSIRRNQYEAFYTTSAGILTFDEVDSIGYSDLMKYSEFALDGAKKEGRNRYKLFDEEAYQKFLRERQLLKHLRDSVNKGYEGFTTHFQPIVRAKGRALSSAEALLRYYHPDMGSVSPAEFIPLLEESGLIIPVGRWVIKQALQLCYAMQDTVPGFKVSFNVSYIQVLKSDVLTDIVKGVKEYDLDPSLIIVELTESGFIESNDRFLAFCQGLKDNGVSLYLDDFGTGYSNFHYLADIAPKTIKVDRTFTLKALKNTYEESLLKHIIDMVHGIKLEMCVEGIETEEELATISKLGPDYIQGYYFGKPCPKEEFMERFGKPA